MLSTDQMRYRAFIATLIAIVAMFSIACVLAGLNKNIEAIGVGSTIVGLVGLAGVLVAGKQQSEQMNLNFGEMVKALAQSQPAGGSGIGKEVERGAERGAERGTEKGMAEARTAPGVAAGIASSAGLAPHVTSSADWSALETPPRPVPGQPGSVYLSDDGTAGAPATGNAAVVPIMPEQE